MSGTIDDAPAPADARSPGIPHQARFATTRWSMVVHAGRGQDTVAQDALARLCETYWFPIYAYVRRRGHGPHDAQDLTQEFFVRMLGQRMLGKADPTRGRFRTFLLTALGHFLSDEWEKTRAQKRGGGRGVDQERLLRDIFVDDDVERLRAASLTEMLRVARRRRSRRALMSGMAASLAVIATVLIVSHRDSPHARTPASRPAGSSTSPNAVKIIDDAQLLALFPDRSVALIGRPGEQRLLFLEDPPRAAAGRSH